MKDEYSNFGVEKVSLEDRIRQESWKLDKFQYFLCLCAICIGFLFLHFLIITALKPVSVDLAYTCIVILYVSYGVLRYKTAEGLLVNMGYSFYTAWWFLCPFSWVVFLCLKNKRK